VNFHVKKPVYDSAYPLKTFFREVLIMNILDTQIFLFPSAHPLPWEGAFRRVTQNI